MKRLILLLTISFLSTIWSYAQTTYPWNRTNVIIGYVGKNPVSGRDTVIVVDSARGTYLPVRIAGEISIGDVTMDTSAQHYGNLISLQKLPMDTTVTFAQNITLSATALPSYSCRQVDVTVDYDYTGTAYVGSVGLTSSTGIPLRAGDAATFYVNNTSAIYCLGSSLGTAGLRIKYSRKK